MAHLHDTFLDGLALAVIDKSADYTIEVGDTCIQVDTSGGNVALTLPSAATAFQALGGFGRVYYVSHKTTGNTLSILRAGSDTINGSTSLTVSTDAILIAVSATEWRAYALNAAITADSIDATALASDSVDSAEIVDGAVDPVHLATTRYRAVAEDGALTLGATDHFVELTSSTTGAKAATMTATHQGHEVTVLCFAASGGSYTLACNQYGSSGTVTIDAAGEGARLIYSGSAWELVELLGTAGFA